MTTMKSIYIVFALLLAHQQMINCFEIRNCAGKRVTDAELISLEVDSCPDQTADRCTFHKGTNATMQIKFRPTISFSEANVAIWGKLGPFYIPFQLTGPTNACGNYGFTCPVTVGQEDTFKISIPILAQYPSLSVSVRFEMNDEDKQPIVCIEFPVKLTYPPQPELAEEQQEEASD